MNSFHFFYGFPLFSSAKSLALVTLRVLEPACELPKLWTQEVLSKGVERVIHGILSCLEKKPTTDENGTEELPGFEDESAVAVSDICFALPLIRIVVNDALAQKLGLTETVQLEAFRIVCQVMELCAGGKEDSATHGIELDDEAIVEMDEVRGIELF